MLRTAGFFALVINVVRLESCITNMVLVCLEGYGFELFFAIFCPLRITVRILDRRQETGAAAGRASRA